VARKGVFRSTVRQEQKTPKPRGAPRGNILGRVEKVQSNFGLAVSQRYSTEFFVGKKRSEKMSGVGRKKLNRRTVNR